MMETQHCPKMPHAFTPFTVQTWNDQELLSEIDDLSIDAARHIAQAARLTGHTGRIIAQPMAEYDYWEVYPVEGPARIGTFAFTTRVRS